MAGAPIPRPPLHKVVSIQLLLLLPVVAGLAWQDAGLGVAVLLGGLTGALPQAWFAWYAFRATATSRRVTERLMMGEATKIGLVALMCAAAFRFVPGLQAVFFFIALMAITVLGWWVTARVIKARV